MKMEKRWKTFMTFGGLLLILMMTAASVSAEDPLARDGSVPDVTPINDTTVDGDTEPMLIAPLENESAQDMVISPGPQGGTTATSSLDLSLLGVIGAVVIIVLALVAIAIRRK